MSSSVTEDNLVHGWALASGARIRQATAADVDAIATVAELAQVPFEEPFRAALLDGSAGAGLRLGLRDGPEAYLRYMGEQFDAHQHNPMVVYLQAALMLVAEQTDHGVVGGLMAYPPIVVADKMARTLHRAGFPAHECYKHVLITGIALTRIKALGVIEHARGAHLGTALLRHCREVYFACNYETIYGMMPDTPGLESFYQRAGFDVLTVGAPLDLWVLFGRNALISPGPGERIFQRSRYLDP